MDISLWYFHTNVRSGVGSYTANLYHSLVKLGHAVEVYRVKGPLSNDRYNDSESRNFGYGIKWQELTLESTKQIMNRTTGIITVPTWKGFFIDNAIAVETLISMGCHVVVHDSYNISGGNRGVLDVMEKCKSVPIVIRESGISMMKEVGFDAVFIPHPYIQLSILEDRFNSDRSVHAVSFTRFDHWKNSQWLVQANENLPDNLKIHLWGSYQKSFMKKEIIGKYKGWDDEKNCTGLMYPKEQQKFPAKVGFTVGLANDSSFVIDMTELLGEGGGTQYTILEAMDGGAIPILNSNWTNVPNSILIDDENCVSVGNHKELQAVLEGLDWESCLDIVDANCDLLDNHSPEVIIPQYEEFLRSF